MRTQQRNSSRLKSWTGRRVGLQRISHDIDCSFFICLKQTLKCQHFDLAIVAVLKIGNYVLITHDDKQRFRLATPAGARVTLDKSLQWCCSVFLKTLLLECVGIPVECRVQVFILGITFDEVVEFFSGSLPVLRFNLIAAFFKNLHRRSVAFVCLHEAI